MTSAAPTEAIRLGREAGKLLGRIDGQNSRFRTAKTTIIKFGLHASFVELESAKSAAQRGIDDKNSVFALLDLDLKFSTHVYFME
ncbi:hypothetical protein TNCV_3902951 [Trichonephila clavipes]|nr:hypothetical protein TNCV_3902951 [Trichonephila clavipes]